MGIEMLSESASWAHRMISANMFYRRWGKRAIDCVVAGVLLIFLSPILVITAVLVRVFLGSPVFFRQVRPGMGARPFRIIKFRSMNDIRDQHGNLLPDAQRLTPIGRLLRATSLDELPELLNVLKGDMSLVGPRPLLMEYLAKYTSEQMRRHEVRPGLTGLAQIGGRQTLRFSQRFTLDTEYVDKVCLALDFKILALTVPRVILSRGVISGQSIADVDDLGLSQALSAKSNNSNNIRQ